jgi:hypothetical protein
MDSLRKDISTILLKGGKKFFAPHIKYFLKKYETNFEYISGKVFNLPLEEDNNLSWDVKCVFNYKNKF